MNATTTTQPAALSVLEPPREVVQATQVADRAQRAASELVIDSRAAYEAAGQDLVDLRARWKAIEEQRVHLKEPFLEGGRRIDAFFKVPLDRLKDAAEVVKSRMLVFQQAEDARVERERREREEQERREREELERQQREAAERERQAREAAEAAERQAREAQEAADREALAAAQQADEAQARLDLAEVAPPMPAVVSQAKATGVATRKTWKVKSVDKAALVVAAAKAIEAGDEDKAHQLLAYLVVDESALNGVAKSLKGAARVPGVVFGEVATLAATGRR